MERKLKMRKCKGKENLQEILFPPTGSKDKSEDKSPFCKKLTLFEAEPCEPQPSQENDSLLVDQLARPPQLSSFEAHSHLGQEAYMPITLELLRKTLKERIKHDSIK